MKFLFAVTVLMLSLGFQARASDVFSVSINSTVEDNVEALLDDRAAGFCKGVTAKRVSQIQTDYKPYRYYIRAWADYVCEL